MYTFFRVEPGTLISICGAGGPLLAIRSATCGTAKKSNITLGETVKSNYLLNNANYENQTHKHGDNLYHLISITIVMTMAHEIIDYLLINFFCRIRPGENMSMYSKISGNYLAQASLGVFIVVVSLSDPLAEIAHRCHLSRSSNHYCLVGG